MLNQTTMQESQMMSKEGQDRIRSIAAENARIYLEADTRAEEENLEMLRQLAEEMKQV